MSIPEVEIERSQQHGHAGTRARRISMKETVDATALIASGADLSGAFAGKYTNWPEGFDPVAAGVIFD
ncbi:MAG: hypothetical protein QF481_11005 [Acidimicrobiales bacterium]|nr:hypothetical protein [Acidimicrobiales bacterium]